MMREVHNYSACMCDVTRVIYTPTIIKFVPLTLANVRFAYHSPRRVAFCRISVRNYSRNCANLSPFVTLVDAVESNDTYKRQVMILINPVALLTSTPL